MGLMEAEKTRKFNKVAVLMGGDSSERDVSLASGAAIKKGLTESGYEATAVDTGSGNLSVPPGTEAVFIALHGEFGEDGGIQGILEQRGIPYTGSGKQASAAAFDKEKSKGLFETHGIPTARYQVIRSEEELVLPFPLVAKPVRQGSSIGVSLVADGQSWNEAFRTASGFGEKVLVEEYIPGRELTVGVVAETALPLVEIVAPEAWYDYNAKYTKGVTRYVAPAPVDESIACRCAELGLDTFRILGCRGFGRVDFRMSPDGSLYVLEVNTIPGFTETSLLPKAAKQAGMSFPELCDRIMQTAQCDG